MAAQGAGTLQELVDQASEVFRQAAGADLPRRRNIGDKVVDYLALLHKRPVPQQIGIGGGAGL